MEYLCMNDDDFNDIADSAYDFMNSRAKVKEEPKQEPEPYSQRLLKTLDRANEFGFGIQAENRCICVRSSDFYKSICQALKKFTKTFWYFSFQNESESDLAYLNELTQALDLVERERQRQILRWQALNKLTQEEKEALGLTDA